MFIAAENSNQQLYGSANTSASPSRCLKEPQFCVTFLNHNCICAVTCMTTTFVEAAVEAHSIIRTIVSKRWWIPLPLPRKDHNITTSFPASSYETIRISANHRLLLVLPKSKADARIDRAPWSQCCTVSTSLAKSRRSRRHRWRRHLE